MVYIICVFALVQMVAAADAYHDCDCTCNKCISGYRWNQTSAGCGSGSCGGCWIDKKASCECAVGAMSTGICLTSDKKGWEAGNGDLVRDISMVCPVFDMGANADNADNMTRVAWSSPHYIPVVSPDKRLEGGHLRLDLGRPGRCAADVFVQVLGQPMHNPKISSSVHSVGECCDACVETEGCVAWVVDGDICTLMSSTTGKWQPCATCISGLDVTQQPAKRNAVHI